MTQRFRFSKLLEFLWCHENVRKKSERMNHLQCKHETDENTNNIGQSF